MTWQVEPGLRTGLIEKRRIEEARPEAALHLNTFASDFGERLFQIRLEIGKILDADRQPHVIGRYAGRFLLVGSELAVSGARRMNGEGFRIADIGEMREQLESFDQLSARFIATLHAESEESTESATQVFLCRGMIGTVFETRVVDPIMPRQRNT